MRYIDLAVAALIGTSTLTGMVAWDPTGADSNSRWLHIQTALRDNLEGFLRGKGAPWLLQSPPDVVCSTVVGASNSTFGMAATVGSLSCGPPPPPGSAAVKLGAKLGLVEVTLVEWSAA